MIPEVWVDGSQLQGATDYPVLESSEKLGLHRLFIILVIKKAGSLVQYHESSCGITNVQSHRVLQYFYFKQASRP